MVAQIAPPYTVTDLLRELAETEKAEQKRRLVAQRAGQVDPDILNALVLDVAVHWPGDCGLEVPRLVLALLINGERPVRNVRDLLSPHCGAYLDCRTNEVWDLCPRTDRTRERVFDLGALLAESVHPRMRDFGRHWLVHSCVIQQDWLDLADTLLARFDDLRNNVTGHYLWACPREAAASFVGKFAPLCFENMFDRRTDIEHEGYAVAAMHRICDALRKAGDKDLAYIVLEMFADLGTIPGPIRLKILNLVRDFGLT